MRNIRMSNRNTLFNILLSSLFGFLCIAEAPAATRSDSTAVDSLLRRGRVFLANRNSTEAEEYFRAALEHDSLSARAYVGLGHAAILRDDTPAATAFFRQAEEYSPDSGFAEYGGGLLHLAAGRPNNAQSDFHRAREKNPSLTDATLQEALILSRRYSKRRDAKHLLEEVIQRDPSHPSARTRLGHLLEQEGQFHEALTAYRAQLLTNPFSVDAVLGIACIQIERRNYREARTGLFNALASIHGNDAEFALAMAVTYLGERQFERAERVFNQALAALDSSERALYEDISLIATREQIAYCDTASEARQHRFNELFWLVFDPTPITTTNERRLEHYRRVWYARRYFSTTRQPYDDRGVLYITYGEPDRRVDSRRDVRHSDPQNFHDRFLFTTFGGEHRKGEHRATIPPARIPTSRTYELWGYGNIRLGVNITLIDEHGSGDYQYREAVNYALTGIRTRFRSLESLRSYSGYEKADVPVIDHGMYPLWFSHYLAQFRSADGRTELDLYMGYPTSQLHYESHPDSIYIASIESGLAIYDASWQPRARIRDTVQVRVEGLASTQTGHIHVDKRTVIMAGGERILLGFQARDLHSGRMQAMKKNIEIRDYSGDNLSMSDIIVARNITVPDSAHGSGFIRSGYFIMPKLTQTFRAQEPVHVYCEIYHLSRGGDYSTAKYEITYTLRQVESVEPRGFWGTVASFFKGPAREVGIGRIMESMHTTQYQRFRLDTSNLEPGTYRLTITVVDLHARERISRDHRIHIREGHDD